MSEKIVENLNVEFKGDGVFLDGQPKRPFTQVAFSGDGTVLLQSALLSPVPYDSSLDKGEHGKLINALRPEIKDFLKNGRILTSVSTAKIAAQEKTSTTSQLSLSVDNSCAALLTGPDSAKNGIDLETTTDYQESTGTVLLRDGNDASVSLVDPVAGIYEVKLTGTLAGAANVVITWINADKQDELDVNMYYHSPATTFRFKVDPAASPVLSIVADIGSPQGFVATNSSGNTSLQWSAPTIGTPVSYKVYSRQDFQNTLTLLATVSAPTRSLVTTHPYSTPRILYAVSAVDSQGHESVLSEIIDNQPVVLTSYVVKKFPWTMFLPAITHKVQ
jgi:hypothetical protein